MPSQLQLGDLLNQITVGVVTILLSLLFFASFFPAQWPTVVVQWNALTSTVSAPLLVPLFLIVAYVVGAILPSPRTGQVGPNTTHILPRWLPANRKAQQSKYPFTEALFLEKAGAIFGVRPEHREKERGELLYLATSRVLTSANSLEQVDIERHIVLMFFDRKMCELFFVATIASLFGAVWSLLGMIDWLAKPGIPPAAWIAETVVWFILSWSCGTKANRKHAYWQGLVMRSFVVSHTSAMITAQKAGASD